MVLPINMISFVLPGR